MTEGASYSVCTTWGIIEARAALLHVLRVQLLYPELRARVLKHARIWGAERVLMEKASSGLALLQDLIRSSHINLIPIKPRLSKLERAEQASAVIEAGRVFFPEEADWLATFEREIFSFPSCVHSDQVDSMTQFLLYWQHGGPRILNANVIGISSGRNTFYSRMGGSFPD